MKRAVLFLILTFSLFAEEFYYIKNKKKIKLIPLDNNFELRDKDMLRFKDIEGKDILIPNRVIVKVKDKNSLEKYIKKYNLKIVKKYSNRLYLLKASSAKMAIEIANILSQKEEILFAQPDLIKRWNLRWEDFY